MTQLLEVRNEKSAKGTGRNKLYTEHSVFTLATRITHVHYSSCNSVKYQLHSQRSGTVHWQSDAYFRTRSELILLRGISVLFLLLCCCFGPPARFWPLPWRWCGWRRHSQDSLGQFSPQRRGNKNTGQQKNTTNILRSAADCSSWTHTVIYILLIQLDDLTHEGISKCF